MRVTDKQPAATGNPLEDALVVKKHNTNVISGQLPVLFHPAAELERATLEPRERVAVDNVLEKLRVIGVALGSPHSSAIRGAVSLRELRPRAGKSPTRVFYRRVGDAFVIASIGPEATVDPRRFREAVAAAQERLAQIASPQSSPRTAGRTSGR